MSIKSRNPIARNLWKFNKPKAYAAKKGKGAYNRHKKVAFYDERRYG